jgi:hypothetical protein
MIDKRNYYQVSVSILLLDLLVLLPTAWSFARLWRKHHSIILSAGLSSLLADASLVLNFLPRELHILAVRDGDLDLGSPWCKWAAVWILATMTSLGAGSVVTARTTYLSVKAGLNRGVTREQIFPQIAACWALGFAVGVAYLLGDRIGTPTGIYCCVASYADPVDTVPLFLFTLACGSAMVTYYYLLLREVKECAAKLVSAMKRAHLTSPSASHAPKQGPAGQLQLQIEPPQGQSIAWAGAQQAESGTGGGDRGHLTVAEPQAAARKEKASRESAAMHPHVVATRNRAVKMVLVFYLCWLPMNIFGLATLIAGDHAIDSPHSFDAIAAWFLKLQPLAHCYLLHQSMVRARKAVYRVKAGSDNHSTAFATSSQPGNSAHVASSPPSSLISR